MSVLETFKQLKAEGKKLSLLPLMNIGVQKS